MTLTLMQVIMILIASTLQIGSVSINSKDTPQGVSLPYSRYLLIKCIIQVFFNLTCRSKIKIIIVTGISDLAGTHNCCGTAFSKIPVLIYSLA